MRHGRRGADGYVAGELHPHLLTLLSQVKVEPFRQVEHNAPVTRMRADVHRHRGTPIGMSGNRRQAGQQNSDQADPRVLPHSKLASNRSMSD